MEYGDGTLKDLRGKLSISDVKALITCVDASLIYFSKYDVYCTDLKPEKILYSYINNSTIQIKFCDYGGFALPNVSPVPYAQKLPIKGYILSKNELESCVI